ncbi:MAG: DUF2799 domain-containing protein [Bacteriovoracaceae bacterium]|nr:DUF2799 domain-containing protein [Bacteriovoracaceae bacterium]
MHGEEGRGAGAFEKFKEKCETVEVEADSGEYFIGRQKGLKKFCTYDSGLRYGNSGRKYFGVCPKETEQDFLKGYLFGRKEQKLRKKQRQLEVRERRLKAKEIELYRRLHTNKYKKACTFNHECTIKDDCFKGTCRISGRNCSFDSDCHLPGDCKFGKCKF